jgi:hypothetical protein
MKHGFSPIDPIDMKGGRPSPRAGETSISQQRMGARPYRLHALPNEALFPFGTIFLTLTYYWGL